jgi:hypothetical protein
MKITLLNLTAIVLCDICCTILGCVLALWLAGVIT